MSPFLPSVAPAYPTPAKTRELVTMTQWTSTVVPVPMASRYRRH